MHPTWNKLQQKQSMVFLASLNTYFIQEKVTSTKACMERVTEG